MTTFATPDFGASASISLFLLIVWATVLLLVSIGIVKGIRLYNRGSPKVRKYALVLILVSGLVPLFCYLVPPHVVRLIYGNYPIGSYPNNKIKEAMSTDEVAVILGSPHKRFKEDDGEHWYYWIDSFGIRWFGVRFGPDGHVVGTHGN
jgi:hypothetical protein